MLDKLPGFTPSDEREVERRLDAGTIAGAAAGYLLASLEAIPRHVLTALAPQRFELGAVVGVKVVLAYVVVWVVVEWPERHG